MALITIPRGTYEIRATESFEFAKFDGYLKVSDRKSSTVTSRPVEAGYDFKDAVHNQSRAIDISIVISDTSQSLLDARSYVNVASSIPSLNIETYVKKQLDIIESFQENRYKVTFKTKYKDYEDYLISNISYDETNDQGLIINFSLVEVREGSVETTDNVTADNYS